eukprot:2598786-Amphidinium_carterae.1
MAAHQRTWNSDGDSQRARSVVTEACTWTAKGGEARKFGRLRHCLRAGALCQRSLCRHPKGDHDRSI